MDDSQQQLGEELLRMAAEWAPAGLLIVDGKGTITLVNREIERLFGWPREELIGQTVEMLVPERLRDVHRSQREDFLAAPVARPMGAGRLLVAVRRDGSEVPVEIGLRPLRTRGTTFVLAAVVDVSVQRALELRMRQAQKMEAIGTLAAGIAHDFNNLLAAIVGFAELSLEPLEDRPEVQADLKSLLDVAGQGKRLVERLLSFSRGEAGQLAPTDLSVVIADALRLLRSSLPPSVVVREHLDKNTPEVMADATQIQQLVMNLASNAAGAMPDGGHLDVTLLPVQVGEKLAASLSGLRTGLYARLTFTDSGTGMQPEVLSRVFDPFFSTKERGSGTGLGLFVVHRIVQGHGGVIHIESEPGRGTTAHVYLPAGAKMAEPEQPSSGNSTPQRFPLLLLVEDEPLLANLTRRQLEGLGYRVSAHTSGFGALEDFRARAAKFSAVITDYLMPHMTGLQLVEELKRIRSDIPVLMLSGMAMSLDREELTRRGVDSVISKPHLVSELAAALDAILSTG